MSDNKRLVINEVRRNLPDAQNDLNELIKYSPTLKKFIENGLGAELLTPEFIQSIVEEIKGANKKQQLLDAFPQVIAGLQRDPFFIVPSDVEEAKNYQNFEEIPLYQNTPLTSVEGAVFLDPETGSLVLAPTPNNRIDAPEKSAENHIGPLTPDDLDVCFILLEDEILEARKQQEIPHALNTVTDEGEIGIYGLTVQDLISANVVSSSAVDAWSAIPEDEHEDYALQAMNQGVIDKNFYNKIPYPIRTSLHWYIFANFSYWLEKAIGPKNFLLLKKLQRLILYRNLLREWKTLFRYLVLNFITSKAQIAGYLIANRLLGRRGAQILGAGGRISSALGRIGQDIFDRIFRAIESGTKETSANKIDAAAKSVPKPAPFKAKNSRKFRLFPNIKEQPSNAALRIIPQSQGFYDPNRVYPRVTHIGEPDTNRLARNHKIKDTIVGIKNEERLLKIPVARRVSPVQWDQPQSPYNSKYPYNHVQETESGHVIEYDDTPNNERMHWYHREGTFMEIDRNGTMVRKIVGDGYEIWERDGYVYIGGKANITVEGNCNIYVKNNVNLQVDGNIIGDVHKSVILNVAKNFEVTAGGVINLKAKNNVNIQSSKSNINVKAASKVAISGQNVQVHAEKTLRLTGLTKAALTSPLGQAMLLGGSSVVINALGLSLMPNPPGAQALAKANGATPAGDSTIGDPPKEKNPKEPKFPELYQESKLDEWSTSIANLSEVDDPSANEQEIKILKKRAIDEGLITAEDLNRPLNEGETDKTPEPSNKPPKIASCSRISGTSDFPPSYSLTKNITLGSLKGTDKILSQHGLTKQDIVCNLRQLSENVIEPIFELIGKNRCIITSCFRYGGQITGSLKPANGVSFHEQGLAVDMCFSVAFKEYYDIAVQLKNAIQYDKLILEYRLGNVRGKTATKPWLHTQWQQTGINMAQGRTGSQARLQSFTMKDDSTYPAPGVRKLINLLPDSTLTY